MVVWDKSIHLTPETVSDIREERITARKYDMFKEFSPNSFITLHH